MAKEAKPRDNLVQNWYHENGAESWEEVAAKLLMLSKLKARGHGLRQQREISEWCRAFDLEKYPPGEAAEGTDWRAALDLIDRWDHELLLDLQTKAALVAKSKQREASKAGHQGFLDWLLTALRGGAGPAHAWTKQGQQPPCQIDEALDQGAEAWDLIGYLEFRAKPWQQRWQRDKDQLGLLVDDLKEIRGKAINDQRPDCSLQQVDKANACFKKNTATSTDNWHPNEVKQLPASARKSLGSILGAIGRKACLPLQALMMKVALLVKPTGGDRPISIPAYIYRSWTATCAEAVSEWDQSFIKHWDTAIRGSSALRAGLRRLLKDEISAGKHEDIMAILWDAEKFYDSLDLRLIIKEGQLAAMDIVVLTVCLEAYLCPRILTVDRACSLPIDIANSILQGCRFANRMCRFVMYKTLDSLHRKWIPKEPSLSIDEYVDDLAQRGAGAGGLLENMAGVAVDLITSLRADGVKLGSKSTIVCSRPSLATALQSIIAKKTGMQLQIARDVRDLGIGYSAGTTRASAYWKARVALNRDRLERIRRLNKAKPAGWVNVTARTKAKTGEKVNRVCFTSAKKLFVTGAWPAISWGHQATGMTPADLDSMTVLAAKASGHYRVGASADVVCLLAYGGASCPKVKQVLEQVKEWIHLWASLTHQEKREARTTWTQLLSRTRGEHRWKAAKGVLAATQATLFEIGWTPSLPFQWKDHEGDYWVQGGVDTKPFMAHLKDYLEQKIWQKGR